MLDRSMSRVVLLAFAVLIAACSGAKKAEPVPALESARAKPAAAAPTSAPAAPSSAAIAVRSGALLADQTNNQGRTGFIWISPMVPTTPGGFTTLDQTGVASGLLVKVDRLLADSSTAAKVSFTGTGITMVTATSSSAFPGVVGPFYGVNWAPGSGVVKGEVYRISVQALSAPVRILGLADVQVVADSTAAGQVDRTKATPLIVGGTLRIVFRLENRDTDGDTVNDWKDNCPVTKNFNQLDSNADGKGNACQCLNVLNGTACATGCKTGETCTSGVCGGGTVVANGSSCSTGNLCKTGEICTSGVCGGGTNRANGTTCGTGNPCKIAEVCGTGVCGGGSNRSNGTTCGTGNVCKTAETCTAGTCGGGGSRTNGTSCSTGNQCKGGEICTSGICGGGSNKANGTACGDGNLCTQADTCQTGICTGGAPVNCVADQCHDAGTCDRNLGTCPARKPDNTACNDGNACTNGESCQAGACSGGTAITCASPDQCHTSGACVAATGCPAPVAKANGTTCNDGDACTKTDSCQAGVCAGANPVTCAAQDQCHTPGTCISSTGLCSNPAKVNGVACDDGSSCTQSDSCQSGACSGAAVTCAPPDQCHIAGSCTPAPRPTPPTNGADIVGWWKLDGNGQDASGHGHDLLPSGNVGTINGTQGLAVNFDGTTCFKAPAAQGMLGMAGGTSFTLLAWVKTSPAITCPGGNYWLTGAARTFGMVALCGTDTATPVVSSWTALNGIPGGLLFDNNWHLSVITYDGTRGQNFADDGYSGGAFPASLQTLQDFGDPFSIGCAATSDPTFAARFPAFKGALDEVVLYNRALTAAEISAYYRSVTNPCAYVAKADGTTCSDGNACTQTDSCQAGTCVGANPKSCSALDQCHDAGICNAANGTCSTPPKTNGTPCDDGNACTRADVCQSGRCGGAETVTCVAPDQCHDAGTCSVTAAQPDPVQQDLIGWWKLDGNGLDSSGGGHNLTVTNAVPAPGRNGTAMAFDGTACLSAPVWDDARMAGAAGVTMMAWVQPDPDRSCPADARVITGRGFDYSLAVQCGPPTPQLDYPILAPTVRPAGAYTWGYPGGAGGAPLHRWTLLTMTWDKSHLSLYQDGKHILAYDVPGEFGDIEPTFTIGCSTELFFSGARFVRNFIGSIDDVSLYRRALSSQEIADYYAAADPCVHNTRPDGTTCNDANACTQTDTCQAGACQGASPVTCVANDGCHGAGTCSPATGLCSTGPVKPDGLNCDDGNVCTQVDVCHGGTCQGGLPVTCAPLDACHVTGSCDSATGLCSNPVSTDSACSGGPLPPPIITHETPATAGLAPRELGGVDTASGTVNVVAIAADGTPGPVQSVVIPGLQGSTPGCTADFDGDTTADLLFANGANHAMKILPRTDSRTLTYDQSKLRVVDGVLPAGQPGTAACGDIDGDGDVDVVLSIKANDPDGGVVSTLWLYANQGAGVPFQRSQIAHGLPAGVELASKTLADFDGDGLLDLAVFGSHLDASVDSQLFVFPNARGSTQPFSQATRVSVPSTSILMTASEANWGALTILDGDADGRPDIWALGNRGALFLYRSLGGFQFAPPEVSGVITDLPPQFTVESQDTNGDGFPELVLGSLVPSTRAFAFPTAPGGFLVRPPIPTPLGSGVPLTQVSPAVSFIPRPRLAQDQAVGLVRGTPVATTYVDEFRNQQPAILVVGVDGHLLERVRFDAPTSTIDSSQPLFLTVGKPPLGLTGCTSLFCESSDGLGLQVTGTRITTHHMQWSWIDHGTPPDTIVDSDLSVVEMEVGGIWLRRVFVRGLDGRLWFLDQGVANGRPVERWLGGVLPNAQATGTTALSSGAVVPLVHSPSVIHVTEDGASRTDVFTLDAAGGLNIWSVPDNYDDTWWTPLGPIGKNNCYGSVGQLGEGSPKAISWTSANGTLHRQVFVVSAMGDLFSWRDGSWQDTLTSYTVVPPPPDGEAGPPSPFLACPNGGPVQQMTGGEQGVPVTTPVPWYSRDTPARGTPDVIAWWENTQLRRAVVVRGAAQVLYEYELDGQGSTAAATLDPKLVDAAFHPALLPEPARLNLLKTRFCKQDPRLNDPLLPTLPLTLAGDPKLVQGLSGELHVLVTDEFKQLNLIHRRLPDPATHLPTRWEWENRPPAADPLQGPADVGISGVGVLITADGLDIYATLANGVLNQAAVRLTPGTNSLWETYEGLCQSCPAWYCAAHHPPSSCPSSGPCPSGASFTWIDAHPPANAPAPLGSQKIGQAMRCSNSTPLSGIFPQWMGAPTTPPPTTIESAQRPMPSTFLEPPPGTIKKDGYESEKMVQIEGVVVRSHISALDNPANHTLNPDPAAIPRVEHDWNIVIAPDRKYQGMLATANILEGGLMEIEWEMHPNDTFTTQIIPAVGDRVAIRGRFIFDCGHPPYRTEIHAPDAMAVIHGSQGKVGSRRDAGPLWYEPEDRQSGMEQCDLGAKLPGVASELGIANVLWALNECVRRVDLTPVSPNNPERGTCYFPYRHSMTDILHDDVSLTFDVPLPPASVSAPGTPQFTLNHNGIAEFVPLPSPHFHVEITPDQMSEIEPGDLAQFSAAWSGLAPPTRTFQVCLTPIPLKDHDRFGTAERVVEATVAGSLVGSLLPLGPLGTALEALEFGTRAAALCRGDDTQELVMYASVNDKTVLLNNSGETCQTVALAEHDVLSVHTHGFECDLSCGEHWDDDFVLSPNDRIGTATLTFDRTSNFGAGRPAPHIFLSQPDLTTPNSRLNSAGDYSLQVRITER